jgi:hypothetical protein
MKLFVGFHYTPEDQWIEDLVIPLLKALEVDVITGKDLHGQLIVEDVPKLIADSDAMVGFFTRPWLDHPWVRDEVVKASDKGKRALAVKLRSLPALGGTLEGRQRIDFDLDAKDKMLVELVQVVCRWKKECATVSFLILPEEIKRIVRPHLDPDDPRLQLQCVYKFMTNGVVSKEYQTTPFSLDQALAVYINNIPPGNNSLIRLSLKGPGYSYSGDYQSFNHISANLQIDKHERL